ncbi:2485_t:CDS:2, partial [Dentiscutata erythropus]
GVVIHGYEKNVHRSSYCGHEELSNSQVHNPIPLMEPAGGTLTVTSSERTAFVLQPVSP